jgi:hypothetical protein
VYVLFAFECGTGITKLPEHAEVIAAIQAIEIQIGNNIHPLYVLDIGMNLGAVAWSILQSCSSCIVFGFEPIPKYFSFAREKLKYFPSKRWHAFNYAICDTNGHQIIHMDSGAFVNVGWNTLITHTKRRIVRSINPSLVLHWMLHLFI